MHDHLKYMSLDDCKKHYGYQREPLIEIPEGRYIIEILHQFLRVSDLLIKLLVEELVLHDKFEEDGKFKPTKHTSLKKLSDYLKIECKFREFELGMTEEQMIKLTKSMQGPTKKLFFKKLNLSMLFPEIIRKRLGANNKITYVNIRPAIEEVFEAYWEIHKIIRHHEKPRNTLAKEIIAIESMTANFMIKFLKVWNNKNITPYLHVTCHHLTEQYEFMNGNIDLYSTEGLEKLNDFTICQFFRATNNKGPWIRQLLERDQRLVILQRDNSF